MVIIHMKQGRKDIRNYRTISLLSLMYTRILKQQQQQNKKRMDRFLMKTNQEHRLILEKINHLQTINQLIETCTENKRFLCIGYIEYEKAFDPIEHEVRH